MPCRYSDSSACLNVTLQTSEVIQRHIILSGQKASTLLHCRQRPLDQQQIAVRGVGFINSWEESECSLFKGPFGHFTSSSSLFQLSESSLKKNIYHASHIQKQIKQQKHETATFSTVTTYTPLVNYFMITVKMFADSTLRM